MIERFCQCPDPGPRPSPCPKCGLHVLFSVREGFRHPRTCRCAECGAEPVTRDDELAALELGARLTDSEILGALKRAHCGTCGHLLEEHGSELGPGCRVLACACRAWVAKSPEREAYEAGQRAGRNVVDLDQVRIANLLTRVESALPADVRADPLFLSVLLLLLGRYAKSVGMPMGELLEHCRGVYGPREGDV